MKYFIIFSFLFVLSCKDGKHEHNNDSKSSTTEEVSKTGPEYTSAYICPMHCKGSGSDKAGVCPTCGMDYVMKKEDGHDHNHDHEGHDHEGHDHEGHDHGKEGHSH